MKRATSAALLLLLAICSPSRGQDWAAKMFDHTSHDFGTVACGAKVEHTFIVENVYEEDMIIESVYSSCGCTIPTFNKQVIATREKAEITAELDTVGSIGRKDTTLTVVFGGEFPGEVQLHLHAYIRSDIVVNPGSVQFGSVAQGTKAQQKLAITYAGRPDWEIVKVESPVPYIEAHVAKSPNPEAGQVAYELIVDLKENAPVGYIRNHLVLVTNDQAAQASRVPLAVEGIVNSPISIAPSLLSMGVIKTGETATRAVIIQGHNPFRITSVESSDPRLTCEIPEAEQTLHKLPITFSAGDTAENVSAKISIQTSPSSSKPLEVSISARVIDPPDADSP
jgi:hypothetical protein